MEHMLGTQAVATHWGELPTREQKILLMDFRGGMTRAQIGPRLPRAGAGPPARGAAAGHPAPGHTARAAPRGTLRPLEDVLALLTGADALHIYRALFGFLHGHVLNELQELVDHQDETGDLLRLGLHRLPIGEFPLLRSLAPVLAAYDGAADLERGLDILLTGLATTLPPPGGARPSGQAAHPASRPAGLDVHDHRPAASRSDISGAAAGAPVLSCRNSRAWSLRTGGKRQGRWRARTGADSEDCTAGLLEGTSRLG
jgi:hypothetical protein